MSTVPHRGPHASICNPAASIENWFVVSGSHLVQGGAFRSCTEKILVLGEVVASVDRNQRDRGACVELNSEIQEIS